MILVHGTRISDLMHQDHEVRRGKAPGHRSGRTP